MNRNDFRRKDEIHGLDNLHYESIREVIQNLFYLKKKKENTKRLKIINFFRFLVYYQEVVTGNGIKTIWIPFSAGDSAGSLCNRSIDGDNKSLHAQ